MITVLVEGHAFGEPLALSEPISFWGGVSPESGTIIEKRHPQFGAILKGKVLMLPAVKGSSSGSSVLAEVLRIKNGPAAIILAGPDAILATGALVAKLLYGAECPVIIVNKDEFERLSKATQISIAGKDIVAV